MTAFTDVSLDPGIRRWLARIEQLVPDMPGLMSPDLVVRRAADRELSDLLAADFALPIPDGVELADFEIPGPGGCLRIRRYRPRGADGRTPSQLWLHGGGFYAGTIDEILNDRLCARRAADSGVQVFSLEYRLAPEHPYPAPVLDAVAALESLADDPDRFGVDPDHIGIGGNSAGAAIAASTALRIRDLGGVRLIHVDLEVPPTAMHAVGRSSEDYAVGFGLDQLDLIVAIYTGPDGPADPRISPFDVDDLAGFPPTLILAAEHDPLRDAGVEFGRRLREAGVPVEVLVETGHLHGTPGITASFDGARVWQERHAHQLALAYGTHPARLAG